MKKIVVLYPLAYQNKDAKKEPIKVCNVSLIETDQLNELEKTFEVKEVELPNYSLQSDFVELKNNFDELKRDFDLLKETFQELKTETEKKKQTWKPENEQF